MVFVFKALLVMGSCLSLHEKDESPLPPSPLSVSKLSRSSKKRRGLGSSSGDEVFKIPGRMLSNGSSNITSLFTQQGGKGINQDAMIVWENFGSRADTIFCGVFDGHGPFGHMVARKVRDVLPFQLNSLLLCDDMIVKNSVVENSEVKGSFTSGFGFFADLIEAENGSENFLSLKNSLLEAFHAMDKELKHQAKFDCFSSGTTAVTLIKQGQDLVIANVGDSRAVLGTRGEDDSLVAVQLTVDLKPDLPSEEERIKRCRGRIFALQNEPSVYRVWLPDDDSPGLAMARAFGDFCLKDFGLISVPDISYRQLTEKDEFIVLATDGVWDVFSNEEVVEIVAKSPSRSSAADYLVQSAIRAWRCGNPTSRIDDCAAVCLYLNEISSTKASHADNKKPFEYSNMIKSGAAAMIRSLTVRSH